MLELFLKAIDRLIDLLKIRDKRFKFRYDEIYKPTFTELEAIHTDYFAMFSEVSAILQTAVRNAAADDVPSAVAAWTSAITLVRERRIPLAPVRAKLKEFRSVLRTADSESLLSAEREFLRSLDDYFGAAALLRVRGRTAGTDLLLQLESYYSGVVQQFAASNNPSLRMYILKDPLATLLDRCTDIVAALDESWADSARSFNRLRFELARHTA
jgi:hypothetical protein